MTIKLIFKKMKRFKIFALLMGAVVAGSFSANAQKIGTVDVQGLVSALPEVQQVQADLEKYQKDSVGARFEQLSKEYAEKDSTYKNPKTVKSVKDLLEKDLADLSMTLNNWQQIGTQAIQSKQQQLLAPLYKKVMDAVKVVAKEKGYTYLFHPDAFLTDPPEADDLTLVVAKKLGLNIPNASAPATPAKPAATTPAKK